MLLKWGTDLADEARDLPCYLEASEVGRPLYRSMGFKDIGTLDIDLERWGGEGTHHHYVMYRESQDVRQVR